MSEAEVARCSLRRAVLGCRESWELERHRDYRLAAMLSRALDLWRPKGSDPLPPEYLAPWTAQQKPMGEARSPEDLLHRMMAWTAVTGGTPPAA